MSRACMVMAFVGGSGVELLSMPMPSPQTPETQPNDGGAASSAASSEAPAGTANATADPLADRENRLGTPFVKHLAQDQEEIWSSPASLRPSDAAWLVPLVGAAGVLFATDQSFSRSLSNSPNRINTSNSFSNYGVAALAGAGAGLYLWGKYKHDERKIETAILSGEAALNSLAVAEAMKYSLGRDRPDEDGGGGRFFQGGSSFPSEHSTVAWSLAGMFAHEYPGPLTSVLAYGMATSISLARVTSKEHFPSDVFVGALLGWWISRKNYRDHHDPTLGGTSWEPYAESHEEEGRRRPANLGSPYVPLDSWVYQAFERLSAMGYVSVANFAIKPWTRFECATMLAEAQDKLNAAVQRGGDAPEEAVRIDTELRGEFARELGAMESGPNQSLQLDSVYGRVTSISGPVLNDGFDFGQTISYDEGRPDREGTNAIGGVEISGSEGPFAFFLDPEYQHAPSAPPLPLSARTAIATADNIPLPAAETLAGVDRLDLLQGYVAYDFGDWQLSAGKQTLSWGPSTDGALMFSNNAEPFPMFRLTQLRPPKLPGILKYIWPARIDNIFGRLEGHTIFPRPFIFGQKATLEWGPYFEFSYSRYTIVAGQGGDPLTTTSWFEVLFGLHCTISACAAKGAPPGESATGSDITLRVPGTHGALLFYVDLYSEDDAFAWRALSESIYRPGLYFARLPGLPRVDLRIEAANSETPFFASENAYGVSYDDFFYKNGFTNDGYLLGNTVGRDGQTIQVSSTYWFSPRTSLQVSYKTSEVSPKFIPQGGNWQDYGASFQRVTRSGLSVGGAFQFEHIGHYPVLFNGPVNNVTATVRLAYTPRGGLSLLHPGGQGNSNQTGKAAP